MDRSTMGVRGALGALGTCAVVLAGCGGGGSVADPTSAGEAVDTASAGIDASAGRTLVELAGPPTINGSYELAVGPDYVYWAGSQGPGYGSVMRIPKGGGAVQVIANMGGSTFPYQLTLTPSAVYFSTDNAIYSVPPDGSGSPVQMVDVGTDTITLASDASFLYWGAARANGIFRMPLGGGSITTVVSTPSPEWLAVDSTNAYFEGTSIQQTPLAGGAITTLGTGDFVGPYIHKLFAVDSTGVYWGMGPRGAGAIVKAPLGGGAIQTLVSGLSQVPLTVAVDSTHVYWSGNAVDANIMKVSKNGGPYQIIAKGQISPRTLGVDATSVYWFNGSTGTGACTTSTCTLMKLTPK